MMAVKAVRRNSVICIAAKKLYDDPGGHKAKLENAFGRMVLLNPEGVRTIMIRKSKQVYDVELVDENGGWRLRIMPDTAAPEKNTMAYMKKLRYICNVIHKWGVTALVKEGLENLNGQVLENIDIDLCIGSRIAEFDLNEEVDMGQQ